MDSSSLESASAIAYLVVSIVVYVLLVIAMWKIFTKAGEAGWKSIIPFLNTYVLFKIAWGNGWLFLLLLVPVVDIVIYFILNWKLVKAYGYGVGMFIVSILFPNIGTLVLGFGSHEYIGPQ